MNPSDTGKLVAVYARVSTEHEAQLQALDYQVEWYKKVLQQYPEAVKAMENRHNVYNETLAYIRQREAGKFAFVIRPEEDLDVGRIEHDRFKIREAYKAGRRAARKRLNALRRFLDAADNEVFADGTYSTNASIIAYSQSMEPVAQWDLENAWPISR